METKRQQARRFFIDAVKEEMKALDKKYNQEDAKALLPFIQLADEMSRKDLEELERRRPRRKIADAAE